MTTWIHSFFNLLFPHHCVVCGCSLSHTEKYLCTVCNMNMPRTHYHLEKDNVIEKQFWGQIPIERATAFFHYRKGSDYCNIIHELKYKGRKEIGIAIGHLMAGEVHNSSFFGDIDVIIPVPLHQDRIRQRGYNQSEWIAKGIAEVTNLPINNRAVVRTTSTGTQTSQSVFERWENVKHSFVLHKPEELQGKHILIVDDVLTTGATIMACASAFLAVEGVRFSVITVGVSR